MKRTALKRRQGLRPVRWDRRRNPKPRKNPMATGFIARVFALYGRKCLVCRKRRACQAHHVVPRQRIANAPHLSQEERDALEYDARNGLPICVACHAAHELASGHKDVQRIPYSCLKPQHLAWALGWGFASTVNDRRLYPRKAA